MMTHVGTDRERRRRRDAGAEGLPANMDIVYRMNMRKPISITLAEDNLLWLRGQAARTAKGSVSEVLDRIVSEARAGGRTDPATVRSVVGTVDLPEEDPDLAHADAYIRSLFGTSAGQPMLVRERVHPAQGSRAPRKGAARSRRG